MRRSDFGTAPCSVARTLDILGDPWTPLILRDLGLGVRRFDQLQADLGLSRKVLTQRLQHLLDHGVIEKVPYQENPLRHEYLPTEKGYDLAPVILAMQAFGDKWETPTGGPPIVWQHDCGARTTPVPCCPECREPFLVGVNATPLRGPGFDADAFPVVTPQIPEDRPDEEPVPGD